MRFVSFIPISGRRDTLPLTIHPDPDGKSGVAGASTAPSSLPLIWRPRAAHTFERRPAARATAYRYRAGHRGADARRSGRFLLRAAPVGPRGPGGRPQATGHVHRLDRWPWPPALPLGDHRQRGGRGARRVRRQGRGHPARRRVRRGPRHRSRHPRGQRAQDQAQRRRARHDPAARRREVRRRLLHRLRRPARRRRERRERAVRPAGHRGRPGGPHLGGELPPRRHRRVQRGRPGRGLRQEVRAAPDRAGRQDQDGHQGPVLARPAGLPARRHLQLRRPRRAGAADRVPGARAHDLRPGRSRAPKPASPTGTKSSASPAASASSASTWRPAPPSPTCSG